MSFGDQFLLSQDNRQKADRALVLAVSSGEPFELKWETNERPLVTGAYSDMATVYSMRHSDQVRNRNVRIIYRELEAERQTFQPPKTVCQSGAQRIENPAPKRLK